MLRCAPGVFFNSFLHQQCHCFNGPYKFTPLNRTKRRAWQRCLEQSVVDSSRPSTELHAQNSPNACVCGAFSDSLRLLQCFDRSRSQERTSELQSLMRTSYAVFCLKQKNTSNIP